MSLFHEDRSRSDPRRLGRLAHFIARHRWSVIGVWIVLTMFGGVAAGKLSSRWYQSLAVPGKPAYEASQRTLKALGVGVRAPNVVVFHTQRRRDEEHGDRAGDAASRGHDAGRAHELVLLDRQPDVRVARPAHDLRGGLSRPATPGSTR